MIANKAKKNALECYFLARAVYKQDLEIMSMEEARSLPFSVIAQAPKMTRAPTMTDDVDRRHEEEEEEEEFDE